VTIKFTNPAYFDLEDIRDYIKRDSIYYANAFIDRIFNSITNLQNFPRVGRVVPEYNDEIIREIIYQNYRIIYKIHDTEEIIYIVVIHDSRKLKKHLKKKDLDNI
jgi:toxin ParE1/3/4